MRAGLGKKLNQHGPFGALEDGEAALLAAQRNISRLANGALDHSQALGRNRGRVDKYGMDLEHDQAAFFMPKATATLWPSPYRPLLTPRTTSETVR